MSRAGHALLGAALLLLSSAPAGAQVEPVPPAIVFGVVAASAPRGIGAELARDYGLELVAEWPLEALQQRCLEFVVAADRVPAGLVELAGDPRLEDVQLARRHHVTGTAVAGVAERAIEDPYFDLQMRTQRRWVEPILRRGRGRGVRIAIIDTGVDIQHPDLIGQITEASNFVGGDPAMVPAEFHGTAVTGLVAARPGNGIGIHGLAPEAEIFALRACWEPTYAYGLCSTKTLAQALDYAIEIRARIINLSLAGPDDPLLTRLVERAIELGAVVFGAVGDDPGQTFPSSIPGVIAVRQGGVKGGAHRDGAELSVPGLQMLSTVPDGRYDFVSGPSFATAHASGVAAVMLDIEPHLRALDLVDWLQRAHDDGAGAAP